MQLWAAVSIFPAPAASSSLSVWQPQLLKGFGLTNLQTGLINSIPYGLAAALGVFWGLHSDHRGERRWHSAIPLLLIAGGFMGVFFAAGSLVTTVMLLSVILISYASFKGPFWAFSTTILSPSVAAAGLAGINAVSNLVGGGMVSLVGAIQDATGSFGLALLPIVVVSLAGALVVTLMGTAGAERHASVADAKA